MPKVSVIIPVYNTEKYLKECLDSVVKQTLRDIEIICINDGSTDNSLEILKEYEQKDNRIKVLTQNNQGLGATRNFGVKIAKGAYLYFLDSDDWMDLSCLEKCYNKITKMDSDICFLGMIKCNESKEENYTSDYFSTKYYETSKKDVFTYKDIKKYALKRFGAPLRMYRTNFFIDNDLFFSENTYCEDVISHNKAILCAKKLTYIKENLTYYRYNPTSLTNSNYTKKKCDDVLLYIKQTEEFLKTKKIFSSMKKPFHYFALEELWSHECRCEGELKTRYLNNAYSYINNCLDFNLIKKDLLLCTYYVNLFSTINTKQVEECKKRIKKSEQNSFLQNLFSVKNNDIRKVITILGIKLKIKSKKLIEQKKWTDLNFSISQLRQELATQKELLQQQNEELKQELATQKELLQQQNEELQTELQKQKKGIQQQETIINNLNTSIEIYFMNKHLNNIKRQIKYPKNAVLSYLYNTHNLCNEYYFNNINNEGNIGDYIQSCAAKQFCEHVDIYTDRDFLSEYNGENINMIMNAWWYIWKYNDKFSDKINPLFVSFHISNQNDIQGKTLEYLKKYEPIGCRDYSTRNFLLKNGIEAYFSGCLTLTLGHTYKVNDHERENNVYLVDYNQNSNSVIDKEIEKIMFQYKDYNIEYIEHVRQDLSLSIDEKFIHAENLIKKYAKAKLVITTRLHCALPCLALGTPVIFVIPHYDTLRYDGLVQLLNTIGYNKHGNFTKKVNLKENGEVYNSDDYKKYSDYLIKACNTFINR